MSTRPLALFLLAVTISGCDTSRSAAIIAGSCDGLGLRVSPPSIALALGDTASVSASPPTCATLPVAFVVRWKSSNAAVATVDSLTGHIRAIAAGQTTVIASVIGDSLVRGAAAVQVTAPPL